METRLSARFLADVARQRFSQRYRPPWV